MELKFSRSLAPEQMPEGNYTGWYWMSNKQESVPVNGRFEKQLSPTDLPFVVEAQLYNKTTNQSISIRHADGHYYITLYDLNNLEGFEVYDRQLLGHRLREGDEYQQPLLKVKDIWREIEDPLCDRMKTLVPFCSVFAGFKDQVK